jgi:peptidoglycan/xylan/chitin deacetylase (PgdA/CDA1 family)
MASRGHELGNHSIFHPCRKDTPKDWLDDAYDLRDYTPHRWTDEMRAASEYLTLVDGKSERTFGNTCCNTSIGRDEGESSIEPLVERLFLAARGAHNKTLVDPAAPNYNGLGHFGADHKTFDELRQNIDDAIDTGHWIIYMIHGVGAETHNHHILPDEHARLVDYLAESRDCIWTAPVIDIVRHLRS